MHPFGFDGVEPRALFGQKQGQNTHALARGFHLLVVLPKPGTHDLTGMPGGIVPDQQPRSFPLDLQVGAAAGQKLRRDVTHGTPIDKPQGHLIPKRGISGSPLPQHAITRQRFAVGIRLLPPLLDKANQLLLILPDMCLRQSKATPPHFIQKANGLVLQPHLSSQARGTPFDMEVFGSGLMSPAPARPGKNSFRRCRGLPHQPPEQASHFGDRQGKEFCSFLLLNLGPLFCPATLTTVKKARANMDRVICRYQLCQWRTS